MKAIYIEGQHEEVIQNDNDLCLFRAPRKTVDGQKLPSGKDLFLHKARTGRETYYLLHWSARPNKNEQIAQISQSMAEKFLEDRGIFFNSVSSEDEKAVATMKQYGWGILEEF